MCQPPFTPRRIPVTHFCYRLSRPQGHSAAGRIRSTEKSNDLIRNRSCDLLACSIVPQPTMLLCVPTNTSYLCQKKIDYVLFATERTDLVRKILKTCIIYRPRYSHSVYFYITQFQGFRPLKNCISIGNKPLPPDFSFDISNY
jgi:hypothetical protein